jgi:hypothetical protein
MLLSPRHSNRCNLGPPPLQHHQSQAESTAVAAALSELEGLVVQLVGVGIYDLSVKEWRARLRSQKTIDDLCE